MKDLLKEIDNNFDEVANILQNHNEVFFIIERHDDEIFYLHTDGSECDEIEFSIYSTTNKYSELCEYAIREMKDGILFLLGVGETEGELEIGINELDYSQLYNLAQICEF